MKTAIISTPAHAQSLGARMRAQIDYMILDDMYGRSVLYELTVDERLVNYFMSKCKSVDWSLKSSLLEATRNMVHDMSWDAREALDKEVNPEYYL